MILINMKKDRIKLGKSNSNLCKLIADQGVNVIFTTVALFQNYIGTTELI